MYDLNGQVKTEFVDSLGKSQEAYGLSWPYPITLKNRFQLQQNHTDTCALYGKFYFE